MIEQQLEKTWNRLMAPVTGDIRKELIQEAAEYLSITEDDAWQRLAGAAVRFREEWTEAVANPNDSRELVNFYNQSQAELFELIEWHATDPIHYRTLVVRDLALGKSGRSYLDYGSGIGSDAIVFAEAGFDVTLADISDVLLGFAAFRCRKRGVRVQTIDLKRQSLPASAFDVVLCLDVLEHIPEPVRVVGEIGNAMKDHGLLVVHAPFGVDPERPMHVVHHDVLTPRMRSLGFRPLDIQFPAGMYAPRVYRKERIPSIERLGYRLYDGYLNNAAGARVAAGYRYLFRRRGSKPPTP